jgi:uncharacterized membrane protein YkvA (DUF1232 family)
LNLKSRLQQIAQHLKSELALYQRVLRHPHTPKLAKVLLWLAVAYVLLPFDLIPDFIPLIGQLDDLVVVPGLIYLALKLIPKTLVEECRAQQIKGSIKL